MNTTNTSASNIGEYVNYLRRKLGLSLSALASSTGLTSGYLSRLERGEYDSITIKVAKLLANAFDMSVTDLLVKSGLIQENTSIPSLPYYLKEKYQLPPEAIDDVELFIKFIQKKYSASIKTMKTLHTDYWAKKTK